MQQEPEIVFQVLGLVLLTQNAFTPPLPWNNNTTTPTPTKERKKTYRIIRKDDVALFL